MVKYFDINDAIGAYGAGQKQKQQRVEQVSLRDMAKSLRAGKYPEAAAAATRAGRPEAARSILDLPYDREKHDLDQKFTQSKLADMWADNERADKIADTNRQFKQFANAREEAEFIVSQNRNGRKPTAAQSDYEVAREQGFGGSFMDFQREVSMGKKGLTSGDRNAILEAEQGAYAGGNVVAALTKALELNDKALSGFGAKQWAYAGSFLGDPESENTLELDNLVVSQALEGLKATFGSMPTEGERKILLEIQGSVNQAPEVRKRIFTRALDLAKLRIQFNQQQAEGIRSGGIYQPGYNPGQSMQPPQAPPPGQPTGSGMQPGAGGGQTKTGIQWSR